MDGSKEGHPRYYERQPVFVLTSAGDVVEAITYVVVPERRTSHWSRRPLRMPMWSRRV